MCCEGSQTMYTLINFTSEYVQLKLINARPLPLIYVKTTMKEEDYCRILSWTINFILANFKLKLQTTLIFFLSQNSLCHFNQSMVATKISNYVNVTSGDQKALQLAIAIHGPVAVGIDASHKSLSFYANGVYYEPACSKFKILYWSTYKLAT